MLEDYIVESLEAIYGREFLQYALRRALSYRPRDRARLRDKQLMYFLRELTSKRPMDIHTLSLAAKYFELMARGYEGQLKAQAQC